jgi:ribokinase
MKQVKAVVQGSVIFDFVTKAKVLPKVGQAVIGTSLGMFSGGKGANQAVQLARLGAKVHLIGRIGRDFTGDFLLEKLRAECVDTSFVIRDEESSTSLCAIHVDEAGHNAIIVVPQANARCRAADVEAAEEKIAAADVVLTQLETTKEAMEAVVNLGIKHGKPVVLNPAPASTVAQEILEKVYILTPNESEAEQLSGISQEEFEGPVWRELAAKRLHELGVKRVLITLGVDGCYYSDAKKRRHVPTYSLKAEDSTGAGDAFNAAFCYALALGLPIDEAIRYGNGAGSLAASRFGSQASLCTIDELNVLLAE